MNQLSIKLNTAIEFQPLKILRSTWKKKYKQLMSVTIWSKYTGTMNISFLFLYLKFADNIRILFIHERITYVTINYFFTSFITKWTTFRFRYEFKNSLCFKHAHNIYFLLKIINHRLIFFKSTGMTYTKFSFCTSVTCI